MSVETDQNQDTQPAAPVAGAATPAPAAPETPAIRVGNSGANIQRANQEMDRQLRAAEEGQPPDPSAGSESADTPSGTTEGGQPPTPPPPQQPSEVEQLRQRLEAVEKERNQERENKRASELQTLNRQQQQEFNELQADAEAAQQKAVRDQARLDALANEYQTAVAERDYETVEALTLAYQEQQQDLAISQRNAYRLAQQQSQFKAYADNQYHEAHMREQAAQIGKIAGKFGLTPDDLKAVKADLDITKPFEVMDVMTAALHKKLSGVVSDKDKALKEQGDKLREEYLERFDNSPGAQPHPGGSTNTASGGGLTIKVGNSKAMLERAWKTQR